MSAGRGPRLRDGGSGSVDEDDEDTQPPVVTDDSDRIDVSELPEPEPRLPAEPDAAAPSPDRPPSGPPGTGATIPDVEEPTPDTAEDTGPPVTPRQRQRAMATDQQPDAGDASGPPGADATIPSVVEDRERQEAFERRRQEEIRERLTPGPTRFQEQPRIPLGGGFSAAIPEPVARAEAPPETPPDAPPSPPDIGSLSRLPPDDQTGGPAPDSLAREAPPFRFSGDMPRTTEPDIPGISPRSGTATEREGPTTAATAGLFLEDIFFEGPGTPDVTDVDERLRGAGMAAAAIATEGVVEDDPFSLTGPEIGLNAAAFAGAAEGDFQQPADLFTVTSGGPGEVDQDIIDSLFGSGGFLPEGERELDAPPGQLTNPFESQEEIEGLSDAEVREQFAAANPGIEAEDVVLGEGRAPITVAGPVSRRGLKATAQVTTFGLDVDEQDIRERVAAFNPGVDPEDVEFTADGQPIVTTGSGDVFQAAAGLLPGVPGAELSERALLQEAQLQQQRFSQSANVEAALRDFRPTSQFIDVGQPGEVGFREEVVQFGAGAAGLPGELAALPATSVFGVEQGAEFAENIPGTVDEFGGPETAATVTEGGARIGAGMVEQAREEPFRFGGEVGAELLFGAAAFSGVQRGARAVRSARVGGPDVELSELSPEEALNEQGIALFETPPGAPTEQAVRELREQAADQPDVLVEAFDVGEGQILLRSESQPIRGDVEVQPGEFELAGMFTSPVLSRIRLQEGGTTAGLPSLRLGLPRLRGGDEQVTAFPGERIAAMPDEAAGFGFAVEGPGGEIVERGVSAAGGRRLAEEIGGRRVPDPETTGTQFLTEQAEPGTAFVRPTGSRTREMEAIFPPGTLFEEVGGFGVRRGPGDVIPGTMFRRVDVDADDVDDLADLEDAFDGELIPGSRIPETRVSRRGPDSEVVVPPGGIPTTTAPSAAAGTSMGVFGGVTATTAPTSPGATAPPGTTTPTTTGGVTDPSGLFTGPTSTAPFSEPTTSAGPTTAPPTTGGPTTGGPTTGPPTTGPPTTGPPTTGPPTTGPPTSPGVPPGGPTSTPLIPGVPGTPTGAPPSRPFLFDAPPADPDPDEDVLFGPLGAQFSNPFQTASMALERGFQGFGGFGGGLFGGMADAPDGGSAPSGDDGPIPNPFF